jgi:general secretion pathway protein I
MKFQVLKRHGLTGFTLLEVMVALAIIATALTAVLGSQSQSVSLAGESKFNTTAPLLAQFKMAQIDSAKPEALASDSGDFGEDFPGYTWQIDVRDVVQDRLVGISNYLKQIDLRVAWAEKEAYQYHLRLYRFFPRAK